MSTCNRMDLKSLRILTDSIYMPKNLPHHWGGPIALGPVYTMGHEVIPRKMIFSHGPTWWSKFCGLVFENINLQSLINCRSLGVNQLWTKRNDDHAPKSECVDYFLNICPKESVLEKLKFDHCFVFSSLHLLFPINSFIWKISITISICHGPLPFFS